MVTLSLHHGSSEEITGRFRPLSHFGTIEAACAVAYMKTLGRGGVIYDVSLSCAGNEMYCALEDWGSARALALLASMMNETGAPFLQSAHRQAIALKVSSGKSASEAYALNALLSYFASTNTKLISYPNSLEGHIGTSSYCVVDPAILTIQHCRTLSPADLQMGHANLDNSRLHDLNAERASYQLPPVPLHP